MACERGGQRFAANHCHTTTYLPANWMLRVLLKSQEKCRGWLVCVFVSQANLSELIHLCQCVLKSSHTGKLRHSIPNPAMAYTFTSFYEIAFKAGCYNLSHTLEGPRVLLIIKLGQWAKTQSWATKMGDHLALEPHQKISVSHCWPKTILA